MSFVSHWPVLKAHGVTLDDLDASGAIRDDVVARWIEDAISTHLALCPSLPPAAARRSGPLPRGEELGRPERVVVSAGAKEVGADSFTVAVRLRPILGGDPAVLDIMCEIEVPAGVTKEIRDELIAIELNARHVN